MRHLLSLTDLLPGEIERVFAITTDLKSKYERGLREPLLPGRVLALLFEKPSLRTRVSFEAGMAHLGGSSLFLGEDVGWGNRESIADFGRVLSQYADAIVCRTKQHQRLTELADNCSCAVINGLTDFLHPCQALADLFTLRELLGKLPGQRLAFIGDSNNVARSLAQGCGLLGIKLTVASPEAYQFERTFSEQLRRDLPDLDLTVTTDAIEAVSDAAAVYTDVWASMGQESEAPARRKALAPYQVNEKLLSHAPDDCYFLHCLPARRGEEVTDEVIDGPRSRVVQQAANRMHVQKGILAWLLGAMA